VVAKVFKSIGAVVGDHSGLSRIVLEWAVRSKELMDASKLPDFDKRRWNELAAFADVEHFKRIGTQKEVMNFFEFIGFMAQWAPTAEWEGSFKRITEQDGLVILELEERVTIEGHTNAVNSISVYEFSDAGMLCHLDVYLQMPSR
jgi:hypothetical protein